MSATSAFSPSIEEQRAYSLLAERATQMAFFVADALAILAAYTLTIVMRGALGGGTLWPQYFRLIPFLAVVPVLIGLMDLYPGVLLNPVEEFRRLTIAITVGMSLVVVATFLVKEANVYSRVVFVVAAYLAIAARPNHGDMGKQGSSSSFSPVPARVPQVIPLATTSKPAPSLTASSPDIVTIRPVADFSPSLPLQQVVRKTDAADRTRTKASRIRSSGPRAGRLSPADF